MRPRFRWWWPDGLVDPAEIRREIDQIAAAGFGGAEIVAVHHSIRDKSVLDPAGHGWGTPAWNAGVEAALDQAARRGITVDLTIGPAWPAAVPTITADDEAAVQELAYGTVSVAGGSTHDGPLPDPVAAPGDGVTERHLVAVHAVRIDAANGTRKETGLDPASFTDLTGSVAGSGSSGRPRTAATGCCSPIGGAAAGSGPSPARTAPRTATSSTTSAGRAPAPSPRSGRRACSPAASAG